PQMGNEYPVFDEKQPKKLSESEIESFRNDYNDLISQPYNLENTKRFHDKHKNILSRSSSYSSWVFSVVVDADLKYLGMVGVAGNYFYTEQKLTTVRMPRQKHTTKKKPSPYSIKQKNNFNTLPNELFLLIFLFLIPNDITKSSKFKLNDRRFIDFQKTKFVNRQFFWAYRYYFSRYETKYCLIQKYNQLYYPPKRYKWNIRYCNIHTWIEVEVEENNQSRHILRYDRYADFGKLYCMSHGDVLLFIESNKVDGYGKKTCDICKSFTYCAKCSYEFRRDD
ncbi:15811_t:CDS:2, partial [Racocetra persica]